MQVSEETRREAYRKAGRDEHDDLTLEESIALLLTSDGRGVKEKTKALQIYSQKLLARREFDQ